MAKGQLRSTREKKKPKKDKAPAKGAQGAPGTAFARAAATPPKSGKKS